MTPTPINWHWNLDAPLAFVDFEAASRVNLHDEGSHAYVRDASTRLLSAVWIVPSGAGDERVTWVPRPPRGLNAAIPGVVTGDAVPDVVRRLAETHTWVAHNAEGFDAMLWAALYPDIRPLWMDSMHLCRVAGMPASLDEAAKTLGVPGKDEDGAKVMKMLTTRPDAVGTVPLWKKLLAYNTQDVETLVGLWSRVSEVLVCST